VILARLHRAGELTEVRNSGHAVTNPRMRAC
jgi:hypothetical protein